MRQRRRDHRAFARAGISIRTPAGLAASARGIDPAPNRPFSNRACRPTLRRHDNRLGPPPPRRPRLGMQPALSRTPRDHQLPAREPGTTPLAHCCRTARADRARGDTRRLLGRVVSSARTFRPDSAVRRRIHRFGSQNTVRELLPRPRAGPDRIAAGPASERSRLETGPWLRPPWLFARLRLLVLMRRRLGPGECAAATIPDRAGPLLRAFR